MARLWRRNPKTPEGKYLVLRRDGTVPPWFWFVLGSRDPAAPVALRAYAEKAAELNYDPEYVADIFWLADEYERDLKENGPGDPDAGCHREDDPKILELMRRGHGS